MTTILEATLVSKAADESKNEALSHWIRETCKRQGYYTETWWATGEEGERLFGTWKEMPYDTSAECVFYVPISARKRSGINGWILKDRMARRLMEGRDLSITYPLTDSLPRPMASADLDKALRRVCEDMEDREDARISILTCVYGYRQTTICRCLDALWINPAFHKAKVILGEGGTTCNMFKVEWEDMLKDIWMHFCLHVEEDVGYLIEK